MTRGDAPSKIFVVLGMHRSGTSVLMRMLEILGIKLGDRLSGSGLDNPRGFFEDRDVVALNEAVLAALTMRWYSLRPINPAEFTVNPQMTELKRNAALLIKERLDTHGIWGFKDPRTVRLWPFWSEVFSRLGLRPQIIVALRHPLSVAQSLLERNEIPVEHSYLLWIQHMLPALRLAREFPFVVVDYDSVLNDPHTQLERFRHAVAMDSVSESSMEIERNAQEFLSGELRHSQFIPEQIDVDPAITDLTRHVYQLALRFSRDAAPDLNEVENLAKRTETLMVEFGPLLNAYDTVWYRMREVTREKESGAQEINQLKGENTRLKGESTQLKGENTRLKSRLADQGALIESQGTQLARVEAMLEIERFTVLRPLLRRGFRMMLLAGEHLPALLKNPLKRVARVCIPAYARRVHAFEKAQRESTLPRQSADAVQVELALKSGSSPLDIIVFPIIDWRFRIQRPQHVAMGLGRLGHRVFYVEPRFGRSGSGKLFELSGNPSMNVFTCRLFLNRRDVNIYRDVPDDATKAELISAVENLRDTLGRRATMALVNLPFWQSVARGLSGVRIVYDCMDYHGGFSTNSPEMIREEERLLHDADLVVTTSAPLSERVATLRDNVIIRNAAEISHFTSPPEKLLLDRSRPIVGYYGAVSEWFDFPLVLAVAKMRPQWDFVLIGSTFGCHDVPTKLPNNVRLLGEKPYAELPAYLHAFDVCAIPFRIVELTRCTNPVKVYEYLSAGKPVVATPLPELVALGDLVRTASTEVEFAAALDLAMKEAGNAELSTLRSRWAAQHGWEQRVGIFEQQITRLYPKVSVVILTYNNLEFTKACLHSLNQDGQYPNMEIILVDNASRDGTPDFLREYARERTNVKIILNETNLGFAAGNNVGLQAATGEFLVILNNDTYVTPGWIEDLIRHISQDNELGLIGPVTNNIGNEARIEIRYENMTGMMQEARRYTQKHARELLYVQTVAFFCAAMPRKAWQAVGKLDEEYGIGFFEDDDYCNRLRQAGFKVGIAEDVFVHHHLSASFNALGSELKRELFERNKRIYERKWGPWTPHRYRQASQPQS